MSEYTPMTDEGRANVQSIIDILEGLGETCGDWSDKVDARQTGYSLHIKFEKKVDVWKAAEHASVLQQCPAKLADACRKLLDADAAISGRTS